MNKSEQPNIISYDNSYSNYKNEDKINNNIYYIILDGMNSIERMTYENVALSKQFENFKKNLIENDYIYLEDSISSYNTTYLSLASIFYNNYPVNENSVPYFSRDLFFPNFFIKNHNNISLINFLKNNNYNFSWIGNNFRPDSLAPQHSLIKNKNFIVGYFYQNISLIFLFFENSYIDGILRKIINLRTKNIKNIDNNDAILKLTNFINSKNFNKNSKNYFFVHHIYPHTPFILNKDCTYKEQANENFKIGYFDNYLCTLNKINDLIDLLSKKDPNSIVVLQADHGWELNKKNSQDTKYFFTKDRIEIFNAVKLPEKYKKFATKELDNVNTSRLLNSIILNVEPELLEKKTYFGYYEFQNSTNYGKVLLYED
ncbi:sulfatase-like hydrolase/transferase [Candidatus Pelagibacter sp.]|nr:sulfatase-like hydrolase/transferase [Candidatus Pelagibacter sp.]